MCSYPLLFRPFLLTVVIYLFNSMTEWINWARNGAWTYVGTPPHLNMYFPILMCTWNCLLFFSGNFYFFSIIIWRLGITFWQELRFCVVFSPPSSISYASHAIIDTDTSEYLPFIKIFVYVELKILKYVLSLLIVISAAAKQLKAGCYFNATEIFSIQTGEQSVMHWE